MNSLIKNLLIAVSLVLVAFFGYILLSGNEGMGIVVTSTDTGGAALVDSDEIRRALNELGSYTINGELFNDQAFKDLRDFRLNLGTEQTSRKNPFAPI
jgi:biopolymer transport protein ExbD